MRAITFSDARENLDSIIDRVVADHAPVAIARRRAEGAVLVSETDWASIQETLYLLSSPRNAAVLLEAVRGLEGGEGEEHEPTEP